MPTPPSSPSQLPSFNPAQPNISEGNCVGPGNCVVLSVAEVPAYLRAALKALCLHTEARTSFITSVPPLQSTFAVLTSR